MTEKGVRFVTHRLSNIATVVALGLIVTACAVDSTLSKSKTDSCQALFEKAFPSKTGQQLWTAGYDGHLPNDWEAYERARDANCSWINQRKPGRPCVDYFVQGECRGRPTNQMPIVRSRAD